MDQEEHPDDGQDGQVLVGPRDPGLCAGVLEHRDGQGRVSLHLGRIMGWRGGARENMNVGWMVIEMYYSLLGRTVLSLCCTLRHKYIGYNGSEVSHCCAMRCSMFGRHMLGYTQN